MDRFVEMQIVRRKAVSLNNRETLAEVAYRKHCAKHKGRNHWKNWERRQIAKLKCENSLKTVAARDAAFHGYTEQVRAYWTGLRQDMPAKPNL